MARDYAISVKLNGTEREKLERLMESTGRTASGIFRHMLDRVEVVSDVRLPQDDQASRGGQ